MMPDPSHSRDDAHDASPAVDATIFEELIAELGEPDGEFLAELITSYLLEGTAQAGQLTAAAEERDGPTFAAISHAWRSTSALIGATTLTSLLLEAEATARESPSELPKRAEAIVADYDRVAAWLVRRQVAA